MKFQLLALALIISTPALCKHSIQMQIAAKKDNIKQVKKNSKLGTVYRIECCDDCNGDD